MARLPGGVPLQGLIVLLVSPPCAQAPGLQPGPTLDKLFGPQPRGDASHLYPSLMLRPPLPCMAMKMLASYFLGNALLPAWGYLSLQETGGGAEALPRAWECAAAVVVICERGPHTAGITSGRADPPEWPTGRQAQRAGSCSCGSAALASTCCRSACRGLRCGARAPGLQG